MTTDREPEGVDRLRVGGWLPPARSRVGGDPARAEAPRAVGAHAAPDDDEPPPPTPYEAPPVDFDAPVSAPVPPPRRRATARRNGVRLAVGVGRYVYQGRRRLGEMIAPGPSRQQARLSVAAVALLTLAVVAVATLSPDRDTAPGGGQGLALPAAPPQAPPPSTDQEIGPADATPTPSPSRTKRTTPALGPFTRSYEAEDAALIGGASVLSLPAASGGRIVQNIGTEPGRRSGLVSFTEVDVPATNRYALTVDYVSGEDRVAILSINTETHLRLSFPSSGGWDVVASRTFTISLVGGRNNLTFSNQDDWAPRLDRINLLG